MHQGFLHYCRSHVRECSRFSTGTFCQCRCLPLLSWPFNIVLCGAAASGRDKQNGMDGFTPSLTGLSTQKRDCQHTNGTVNTQTGLSTHRRDCQHTDGTVSTRRSAGRPQRSRDSIRDPDVLRADPDGRRPPRLSLLAQIHIQRWFHLLFFFPFHLHFGLDRWSAVRYYATARQVPLCSKM